MDSQVKRVALLIDTSTSWGVRLLRGINDYAKRYESWIVHIEPRGRYERLSIPQGWKGDGIIARVNSQQLAKEIVASKIPAVDVSWFGFEHPRIARCTVDECATARLAADYFLESGFRHFGYFGPLNRPHYVDRFGESFRQKLEAETRHQCTFASLSKLEQLPWSDQLAQIVAWLNGLPRPTAVLAWSAIGGRQVTEACHYGGIRVPEDVAVLGGEYDELMQDISRPPLSTVDQPAEQAGAMAAKLLAGIMNGQPIPSEPIIIPPSRINVKHSTEVLAVEDSIVREAMHFINENSSRPIRVGDIVKELKVARRTLEQHFLRSVSRTPAEEIRRVRINEAKRLLSGTDLKIVEIAKHCGFTNHDLFARTFRQAASMTPTEYRRMHRIQD